MRSLIVFAILAIGVGAQARVCVTGRITPVGGPTICMQGESHYLESTGIYLKSRVVDLSRYNGKVVEIVGRDVGVTCRVIEVEQVLLARATLEWCGSGSTGCPVKFRVCPGGLGYGWLFWSVTQGYLPLGCSPPNFIDGTVLLGPPIVPLWEGWLISGCAEITVQIPWDNSLVGFRVWLQAVRMDIGPVGPLILSNAVSFQIAPFMPPCAPTADCAGRWR